MDTTPRVSADDWYDLALTQHAALYGPGKWDAAHVDVRDAYLRRARDEIERRTAAVLAERERCAKVCEDYAGTTLRAGHVYAKLIRRGM